MLEINGLCKRFGDKEVLCGVDMRVAPNSIFGFVGRNGAGKTTTMKAVLGLIKTDGGEIYVDGERVCYGNTPTNRKTGYLPDVPEFYPFMTAREYLSLCADITGIDKKEAASRTDELLALVGLSGERHRIGGYSRGMKQRLGIAQALFTRPKLLICDEPTSALDPVGRKEILDILGKASLQTTVLFSTHILSDVERICTDVAFLDGGKIALNGKLADIKARYSTDEYVIETENGKGAETLLDAFGFLRSEGGLLCFKDEDGALFRILRFVSDSGIPVLRIERREPSLEALFMEAVEK